MIELKQVVNLLEKMLKIEQRIKAREDKEVTVDYASVVAENNIACIENIIKSLRKLSRNG